MAKCPTNHEQECDTSCSVWEECGTRLVARKYVICFANGLWEIQECASMLEAMSARLGRGHSPTVRARGKPVFIAAFDGTAVWCDPNFFIPKLPFNQGGLMRCCIASLYNSFTSENEGDTFTCSYCKSHMIVKDGVWVWDHFDTIRKMA